MFMTTEKIEPDVACMLAPKGSHSSSRPPVTRLDEVFPTSNAFPDQFDEQAEPPRFDAQGRVKRCCGEDRPGSGPRLEIVAKDGSFVTAGQFVNTVHPWLRSLDGQLRAAAGVVHSWPLDPAIDLIVRAWNSPIRVAHTKGWKLANFTRERQTQVKIARKALENMEQAGL